MKRNARIALFVGLGAAFAVLGAVLMRAHRTAVVPPVATKGAPSYWYDPMHPSEHFEKSGKSPFMEMRLVPKYADRTPTDAGGALPGSIAVDSRVVENLGVRLAKVEQSDFARMVD